MGVVINHRSDQLDIAQLCETLEIGTLRFHGDQPIHIGGPVDGSRGFVLHSQDHMQPESVAVTHEIGLTSSVNILRDITNGIGPVHSIISLGYAGWHAGQLERELSENIWLNLPLAAIYYLKLRLRIFGTRPTQHWALIQPITQALRHRLAARSRAASSPLDIMSNDGPRRP